MPRGSPFSFTQTLEVRDHCLCLHTQRAARALARRFDEAFRHVGLTSGQFSILVALNRPEAPTMGAVATLLAMDRTTLTAALKRLERAGYVTSAIDPDDRRARRLRLTAEGQSLLSKAGPIWREAHVAIEAGAPAIDFFALRSSLRVLGLAPTATSGSATSEPVAEA